MCIRDRWYVEAVDNEGSKTSSDVWTFRTLTPIVRKTVYIYLTDVKGFVGEEKELLLGLKNAKDLKEIRIKLKLPKSLKLVKVDSLLSGELNYIDNEVSFALSDALPNDDITWLFRMVVRASEEYMGEISISEILLLKSDQSSFEDIEIIPAHVSFSYKPLGDVILDDIHLPVGGIGKIGVYVKNLGVVNEIRFKFSISGPIQTLDPVITIKDWSLRREGAWYVISGPSIDATPKIKVLEFTVLPTKNGQGIISVTDVSFVDKNGAIGKPLHEDEGYISTSPPLIIIGNSKDYIQKSQKVSIYAENVPAGLKHPGYCHLCLSSMWRMYGASHESLCASSQLFLMLYQIPFFANY